MRRKRLKANFIAGLTGKGVHLLRQVALVPLLISYWGAEYYGAWLVVSAIPSFLAMSKMGLGTAAATRIVLENGEGNHREANAILLSACLMISVIGFSIVTGLWFLPMEMFSLGQDFPVTDPGAVVSVLMAGVAMGMLTEPVNGSFVSAKRASLFYYLAALNEAVKLGVIVAVVIGGGDALAVAFGGLAGQFIMMIVFGIVTFRLTARSAGAYVSFGLIKSLFAKGAGFQLGALWQAIFFQGSIWVANALLGPAGAATWGTLRILSRTGNQLLGLINQSVMPELQTAVASRDLGAARKLHAFGLMVTGGIAVCFGTGLIFVGPYVYRVWTQAELSVPWIVWPLLCVGILLNSLWWASGIVHRAFNLPWQINSAGVLAAVVSVAAMGAMAFTTDNIAAFPAGAIVFEAIMAAFVLKRSLTLLGDSFGGMVNQALDSLNQIKFPVQKRGRLL